MLRAVVLMVVLLPVAGWAAAKCPDAPGRPVCIPVAGEFDNSRELERCGRDVQAYAAAMKPVFECERNPQRKAALRADVESVKVDFEDAADGMLVQQPGQAGVPPSPPDVGGGPAGAGVRTSAGVQPQIYVNAGEGSSSGSEPYPPYPQRPYPQR